jgi:hypothetical protein
VIWRKAKAATCGKTSGRRAHRAGERTEGLVAAACRRYAAEGRALITKRPTPYRQLGATQSGGTFRAVRMASAGVDYSGVVSGGRHIAFDVKSSSTSRLPLEQRGRPTVKRAQADELDAVHRMGGIAGLLVATTEADGRAWRWLPWSSYREALADAGASLTRPILNTHAVRLPCALGLPDFLDAATGAHHGA